MSSTIGNALWFVCRACFTFITYSHAFKVIGYWAIISPAFRYLHGAGILSVIMGICLVLMDLWYNDLVNVYPTWLEVIIVKTRGTKMLRS